MGWLQDGRKGRITPAQEADVQIALARVAESEGDVDRAELAYRQALKRDKRRSDAHLHLANIHTLKGQYRGAVEEYQRALEINPGNADVFCDMGYSLYLQRKLDEAERNLKQALAIDPNHQRAHNNLALVFAHSDRPELALTEFRKAGNSPADAQVNLAFSLAIDKRWPAARAAYRRALEEKPITEIAKSRLTEIGRLITANDLRTPRIDATRDTQTVAASAESSVASTGPVLLAATASDPASNTVTRTPKPAMISGLAASKPAMLSATTASKPPTVSATTASKPPTVSAPAASKPAAGGAKDVSKPSSGNVASTAKRASKTKIPPPKPPRVTAQQPRVKIPPPRVKIPPPRVTLQPPTELP
jgi:Tfp pilus assembly protein PilF